jgi:hypothetical protein
MTAPNRTAYARKTEITRNAHYNRAASSRWYARTGGQIPEDKVNDLPAPNTTGSLRYHLIRECQRYYANEAVLKDAKAIVQAGIAKGLVHTAKEPCDALTAILVSKEGHASPPTTGTLQNACSARLGAGTME